MKAVLHIEDREAITIEVDKVLAATEVFPYWAFWYPEDKDGDVRVRFIKTERLLEVDLVGQETERQLATVTPIKGGE